MYFSVPHGPFARITSPERDRARIRRPADLIRPSCAQRIPSAGGAPRTHRLHFSGTLTCLTLSSRLQVGTNGEITAIEASARLRGSYIPPRGLGHGTGSRPLRRAYTWRDDGGQPRGRDVGCLG